MDDEVCYSEPIKSLIFIYYHSSISSKLNSLMVGILIFLCKNYILILCDAGIEGSLIKFTKAQFMMFKNQTNKIYQNLLLQQINELDPTYKIASCSNIRDEKIKTIYHYTTLQGLEGILSKKYLFSNNILYFFSKNGFALKELQYPFRKFSKLLENNLDPTKHKKLFEFSFNNFNFLYKNIANRNIASIYATSFSDTENNNHLWENFANQYNGFVIKFNKNKLIQNNTTKNIHSMFMNYGFQNNILENYKNYLIEATNIFDRLDEISKNEATVKIILEFLTASLFVKKEKNNQEMEYRIIQIYRSLNDIPYDKIITNDKNKIKFSFANNLDCVEGIIIGNKTKILNIEKKENLIKMLERENFDLNKIEIKFHFK